jgi:hypothetical protein
MSENELRRVFVGYLPAGGVTYVAEGEVDPVATLIADANAKLDRQHAEAERVRLAAIADVERAKSTRSASAARRFRRALRLIGIRR